VDVSDRVRRLTDEDGRFAILALDHRDSLRVEFDRERPDAVAVDDLVRFKLDAVAAFGRRPSAIILDPEYSLALAHGDASPGAAPTICALEAQGHQADPSVGVNGVLDGWTVARASELGVAAVKMLVLYRPDRGTKTETQERLVRTLADDARAAGLALVVEPIPYDVANVDDHERTVVASAARMGELGADLLKLPFPTDVREPDRWEDACRRVSDATDVPWTVLSSGAPFDVFVQQVTTACGNGCAGFMAGRTIWGDAVHARDRAAHLADVAIPRFETLRAAMRR
jgi:tagatose-1,6-bisphosphate aldolase